LILPNRGIKIKKILEPPQYRNFSHDETTGASSNLEILK